jgi:glucose/arabinose dehydrogenase
VKRFYLGLAVACCMALFLFVVFRTEHAERANGSSTDATETGPFTDFHDQTPGRVHHITADDLPRPYASPSSANPSRIVDRPSNVWPQAPAGFKVELYAGGLKTPRLITRAPNGDLFVASYAGQVLVFRGITPDGRPEATSVFTSGLHLPFGIAFYPPGPNPQYVYVGNTNNLVRYPYQNGDLKARGPQEVVIPNFPTGGHPTRNVIFSPDGQKMFIGIGSNSNVADVDTDTKELHRANILVAKPDGSDPQVYASGIRNPVGITIDPQTGEVWTSVNERDALGDNLPPDYITHVQEGGFYGWPWFYTGGNQDPRFPGKHPELRDKVIVPDVLLEPHDASLQLTFYQGTQFPEKYRGQIFAAEHGSWNRSIRTGYEVIFVPVENGRATGSYEDFITGFVTPDGKVWGRPVGVAVATDGSLIVSDDGSGSIWRVSYTQK